MKNNNQNYLEKIPTKKAGINWTVSDGAVTVEIENKGAFNRIAQTLFKKPKISYIHLEEFGSFVWPIIDGQKNLADIGTLVKEHFGDKAEPLYPRLIKYFETLQSYGFITLD